MKEKLNEQTKEALTRMIADGIITSEIAGKYFPELKESEGSRMKKSFVRLVKAYHDVNFPTPEGFTRNDMLAWLEKQGEKTNNEGVKLWSIKDAKPGDILATSDSVFIYNGKISPSKETCGAVCGISYNDFTLSQTECKWTYIECVTPATKEQRDLLFKKMREAGFEWNDGKLELRQIEQKPTETVGSPAWSEEDKERIEQIVDDLKCGLENFRSGKNVKGLHFEEIIKSNIDWLKSLKDRVGCEVNCTTYPKN